MKTANKMTLTKEKKPVKSRENPARIVYFIVYFDAFFSSPSTFGLQKTGPREVFLTPLELGRRQWISKSFMP